VIYEHRLPPSVQRSGPCTETPLSCHLISASCLVSSIGRDTLNRDTCGAGIGRTDWADVDGTVAIFRIVVTGKAAGGLVRLDPGRKSPLGRLARLLRAGLQLHVEKARGAIRIDLQFHPFRLAENGQLVRRRTLQARKLREMQPKIALADDAQLALD